MKTRGILSSRGVWLVPGVMVAALVELGCTGTMAQESPTFSSFEDWGMKAENLSPTGQSPYLFPLEPGFRFVLEDSDHPGGRYRKEVTVLEETEPFDIPGVGQFEAGVVQEDEFVDGAYRQQVVKWIARDATTNDVYLLGEVSWEIDADGDKSLAGMWRAGETDDSGVAEPGLLVPGNLHVGDKYARRAYAEAAQSYMETMESGRAVTVPAGTFEDCVRLREHDLTDASEVTDQWWCRGVGLVQDATEGDLVASDVVSGTDTATIRREEDEPSERATASAEPIGEARAKEIALEEIPGRVTSVEIERVDGHDVYTIEILADKDGGEWDVFVDMLTGEVVGTDN